MYARHYCSSSSSICLSVIFTAIYDEYCYYRYSNGATTSLVTMQEHPVIYLYLFQNYFVKYLTQINLVMTSRFSPVRLTSIFLIGK